MRNSWLLLVVIAVVGALAGVVIAGRQEPSDTLVLSAVSETVGSDATVDATSTTGVAGLPSASSISATSTSAPTTTTSTTPVATSTTGLTTTSSAASTVPETDARGDVRLVLANGDGRFNLVGRNASRLMAAGYVTIDQTDTSTVDATVLYYRPGFDDEAAIVAADLLVPDAILLPLPDTPVTTNDGFGDIIIVLGPDSLR